VTFVFLSAELLDLIINILNFLKPISNRILLQSIFLIMHGDHFVSYSSKFNSVANTQFISFVGQNVVVLVIGHVLHTKPKFFTWRSFFFFGIFNCIFVIYPKIVIFKKCSGYHLFVIIWWWFHFLDTFFISSHCFKIIKVFLYYIVAISF